jgi:hypothetical protein
LRHITDARLDTIEDVLAQLRTVDGLVEKKRGVFYRGSRAFLHFHEDGSDVYADVRLGGDDFERVRATSTRERSRLVTSVRKALA